MPLPLPTLPGSSLGSKTSMACIASRAYGSGFSMSILMVCQLNSLPPLPPGLDVAERGLFTCCMPATACLCMACLAAAAAALPLLNSSSSLEYPGEAASVVTARARARRGSRIIFTEQIPDARQLWLWFRTNFPFGLASGGAWGSLPGFRGRLGRMEDSSQHQDGAQAAVWVYSGAPHCCVYKGHTDSVICLQSAEGKLISGSVDTTIRVWSVQQPACENVLQGHTDWVRCMHCSGSILASGSDDHTIRIWDLSTNQCIKTLEAQSVNCVQLLGDTTVFYGTEEGYVHSIDISTGKVISSFEGHTQSVNCMTLLSPGRLLTGSGDCTVRVWNIETSECMREVRTHSYSVNCMSLSEGNSVILTGSGDCTIHAVDLETSEHLRTFAGHTSPVFCIKVLDNVVVSGSGDCSLRIWSLTTSQCLRELPGSPGQNDVMLATGHMDWVNAVDCAEGYIFSGSVDRTIRRWHLATLLSDASQSPMGAADGDHLSEEQSFVASVASLGLSAEANGREDASGDRLLEDVRALTAVDRKEGFSWGHNRDGALGLGTTESHSVPRGVDALDGCGAMQVACGGGNEEHHTCVITADGGLLTFGSGISGQLGQDNTQNLPLPVPVPELMGTRICGVACGSAHTLVVTVEGRLLSFGWGHFGQLGIGSSVNSSTPVPVTTLEGHRVVKIACGSAHSVACTDNGRIFTWGWGVNGQLGHGDDASLLLPSPVKKLESIYISQVSCGLAHTVAISQVDQAVYTWGWDEYGQLGHGGWDIFGSGKNRLPRQVKDLVGKSVAQAACGSSHTLVLTTKGEIYAFGWGKDGQLGLGASIKDRRSPTMLRTLGDVVKISACGSHSMALQHSGGLFSWGNNTSGQLGLGHTEACSFPTRITTLEGYTVRDFACAGGVRFGHTVVLVNVTNGQGATPSSSMPRPLPQSQPTSSPAPLHHQHRGQAAGASGGGVDDMISFDNRVAGSVGAGGVAVADANAEHQRASNDSIFVNSNSQQQVQGHHQLEKSREGEGVISKEDAGMIVEELPEGAGGGVGAPDASSSQQMTARERLSNMGKRVRAAHLDHTSGLTRLLSEFEGLCEGVQRRKKECAERRHTLAARQAKLQSQLEELRSRQVAAADAERYEEAETWSSEIAACEIDKGQCQVDVSRVIARFEELEEERTALLRKQVLARREAFKFLSSIQQDANAKAQQYITDSHEQVELERSTAERNVGTCQDRLSELKTSVEELTKEIEEGCDKAEMMARKAKLEEAQGALEEAQGERRAIEDQIEALKRALAVKLEREMALEEAKAAAVESIKRLEEREESGSRGIIHSRKQLLLESSRVEEELQASLEHRRLAEREAELLREAEEEGEETLQLLLEQIEESKAALAKAETEQRRRVELAHRRRRLISDDPVKMSEDGTGDSEMHRLEAEIDERTKEVLSLKQRSSKISSTASTIRGQLSELEVKKQMSVDVKNFTEAAQIKNSITALNATVDNETMELSMIEERLASLEAEIAERRALKESAKEREKTKEVMSLSSKLEMFKAHATELQLLMEAEIEDEDYEAAAMLQAEIDTVHAWCRMLGEEVGVGIGSSEGGAMLGEHEHGDGDGDGGCEGASEVGGLDGSQKRHEDDSHHCSQESHSPPGEDAAHKPQREEAGGDGEVSAQVAELENRIVVLTEQLEEALRDEEFDLCDSLNAEITAVTEQKDALLQ